MKLVMRIVAFASINSGRNTIFALPVPSSAVAWGFSSAGGDASAVDLTNVADISCGGNACVARRTDGSAVAWGYSNRGGDASAVDLSNVADISCGLFACVAHKEGKPSVQPSEKPTVQPSEKPTVPTSEAWKNYGNVGFSVVFASFMYHLW